MADVQSRLSNWSTNESSNAPTGPTVIGSGLDDNLRQIQATVRAELANKGLDIASAATTDIGAVVGSAHNITGSTTITNLGTVSSGIWKVLQFTSTCVLKGSVSLVTPNSSGDITASPGDCAYVYSEGSGVWRMPFFQKNDGSPITLTTAPIRALTAETSISTGDLMPVYDVSAVANRVVTYGDVLRGINNLTEDTTPVVATDYILSYDVSADQAKKVKPSSFGYSTGWTLSTETSTTSGTAIDFTGIPTTAREVTVNLSGVSTSGTSNYVVQIGPSGGVETSGYNGAVTNSAGTVAVHATSSFSVMTGGAVAAANYSGQITFKQQSTSTNTWTVSAMLSRNDTAAVFWATGHKALSGALSRVRITTSGGTDTFDAGSINVSYI